MRSIWKGAISFGLVSIPIKVIGATENHSVSLRQIHTTDGGRIRYRKICELEDAEVSREEIGRAYETADGTMVELSEDDLAALPLPTARTVELLGFLPLSRIDPIQLDRSYYLAADSGGDKPYVLLREALRRSDKGAVAKFALRGRETLGLLRVLGDVIALHTMLWPDEIRSAEGIAPQGRVTVRDAELDLADTLMATLGEVRLSDLRDEYRAAMEELVAAKLSGQAPSPPSGAPAPGRVIDLMSALEDSVRAARESRGESPEGGATVTPLRPEEGEEAEEGEESEAATGAGGGTAKRGAKRAPAKRTAKKATARKTARKTAERTTTKEKSTAGGRTRQRDDSQRRSADGTQRKTAKKSEGRTAARKTAEEGRRRAS